ncbi:uncharacterized protein B0H18DRAFT_1013751 [Fomitopsis serialis]|uniref:uncharacterized protein n=1 Tax=Fomitopsis serialis TaxID=139415 RepID=UPI002008A6FF|nr:uncharacterized protein B0H18DRAFT_1013751 [Neoantrodia serialis]KAH9923862.1 hypothetical protein B0H18DRAFT_1013751 [Neoantrodia serialis]
MANTASENVNGVLSVNLASICIESLLCGMFDSLTVASIYILHIRTEARRGGRPPLTLPVLVVSGTLLVAVTTHWILSICRLFIGLGGHGSQAAVEYLTECGQPLYVAEVAIVFLCTIVADAVLVFRLWVVWSHNKTVVVPPLAIMVGLVVCSVGGTYTSMEVGHTENDGLTSKVGKWTMSGLICTLCTDLYCSCMIAGKLLRTHRCTERAGASCAVILNWLPIYIESAAFYTAWTLFYAITYGAQSAARYIGAACLPAAAGIACTLINVHIGFDQLPKSEQRQGGMWDRAPQFTTWIPEWVSETYDNTEAQATQSRDSREDAGDKG